MTAPTADVWQIFSKTLWHVAHVLHLLGKLFTIDSSSRRDTCVVVTQQVADLWPMWPHVTCQAYDCFLSACAWCILHPFPWPCHACFPCARALLPVFTMGSPVTCHCPCTRGQATSCMCGHNTLNAYTVSTTATYLVCTPTLLVHCQRQWPACQCIQEPIYFVLPHVACVVHSSYTLGVSMGLSRPENQRKPMRLVWFDLIF